MNHSNVNQDSKKTEFNILRQGRSKLQNKQFKRKTIETTAHFGVTEANVRLWIKKLPTFKSMRKTSKTLRKGKAHHQNLEQQVYDWYQKLKNEDKAVSIARIILTAKSFIDHI